MSSRQVLDVVKSAPDDETGASQILSMSGKTRAQCEHFTRRFRGSMGVFLAMMDADENRLAPGIRTALLRWIYNRIIMPPAYLYFGWRERRAGKARTA